MNLVNHQSFHWTRDLLPALHATGLGFEVGQKEWVDRLRASNPDPIANPPIKLLEFFASKYDNNNNTKRADLTYDTREARSFSSHLAAAPVLNQEIVSKFIQHWTSTSWTRKTAPKPARRSRLVVLAGPCGSGKSTLAAGLAEKYHVRWVGGDNLHSLASLNKMTNGEQLSSADRWAWLSKIKDAALAQFETEASKPDRHDVVVVTCFALRAEYRSELRKIAERGMNATLFVLQAGPETLKRRTTRRVGHYVNVEMVEGQVGILEAPRVDETDVMPVDAGRGREEVQREVDALFEDITEERVRI